MSPEELRKRLHETLEGARNAAARYVGVPFVLTLEGLGYRIVPASLVTSLEKMVEKAASEKTSSP